MDIGGSYGLLIVDFYRALINPNSQMRRSKYVQNSANKTVNLIAFTHQNNLPITSYGTSSAGLDDIAC
jgi:hypothetical protein